MNEQSREELREQLREQLREHMKSHPYFANPEVTDFWKKRKDSLVDLTVYEWISDLESRCLRPVSSDQTEINCCICKEPAKNPFRCSKDGETVADYNKPYTEAAHIYCYQCISDQMLTLLSDAIPCPMCRRNKLILKELIPINDELIQESQKYMVYCENNCGLMGDPIALAHHICPLSDGNRSGHTLLSNVVHALHKNISVLNDQNENFIKSFVENELKRQKEIYEALIQDKKNVEEEKNAIINSAKNDNEKLNNFLQAEKNRNKKMRKKVSCFKRKLGAAKEKIRAMKSGYSNRGTQSENKPQLTQIETRFGEYFAKSLESDEDAFSWIKHIQLDIVTKLNKWGIEKTISSGPYLTESGYFYGVDYNK